MSVYLSAWNLREGLALAEHAPRIVEAIRREQADVVALSDAYWLDNPLHGADASVSEAAKASLATEGYVSFEVPYDDDLPWPKHYMTLLSRLPLAATTAVRLDQRNAIAASVQDPATGVNIQLLAAHYDDRSTERRLAQNAAVLSHLDLERPGVMAVDLNDIQRDKWVARALRNRLFANAAPRIPHARARTIATRLSYMACGAAYRQLVEEGLQDADSKFQSSMPSRTPFFPLDRIFTTKHAQASNFKVGPYNPASDHRRISAVIST